MICKYGQFLKTKNKKEKKMRTKINKLASMMTVIMYGIPTKYCLNSSIPISTLSSLDGPNTTTTIIPPIIINIAIKSFNPTFSFKIHHDNIAIVPNLTALTGDNIDCGAKFNATESTPPPIVYINSPSHQIHFDKMEV